MRTYKAKQYLFHILKVVVVITALFFIYTKIQTNHSLTWKTFGMYFKESDILQTPFVIAVLFLSASNWFFEILKWQVLSKQVTKISFFESMRHVLSAQTASIFTPLKIGEYGVKTLFFEQKQVKKVIFLNFLGNFNQMLITLFFGIFGLYFFIKNEFSGYEQFYPLAVVLAILFFLVGNRFSKKVNFSIGKYSFIKIKHFLKKIPQQIKYKILIYSFMRYLSFSLQFFLLLNILVPVPLWETVMLIFSFYLLSSLLPVMQFFDVAVKGSVALLVFTSVDVSVVLFVTSLMWVLNTVLPALIGVFFVINLKFQIQSTKYQISNTKFQVPITK